MPKKDNPLLALYAAPEKVESPKDNPVIVTTKAREEMDGSPGEPAMLAPELSQQEVGHQHRSSPVPRKISPMTEQVMTPSRLGVISPHLPGPSQTQESKDRRTDVYRSLKDLLKADKKNLKLEIQADGTKRLVMDLSDVDTVFGDFSVLGKQR